MKYIYLAAIGTLDDDILAALEISVWHAFGFEVRRMSPLGDPSYAFDGQRNQYSSTMILRELVRQCPPDAVRLLAVTELDLFIPMLSFIYGQAQLDGRVSIVSLARLRQEFYTLPPNRVLAMGRLIKEAVHELGHTFGLTHCIEKGCPMSLATNIHQLDLKGTDFCNGCSILVRESMQLLRRQTPGHFTTEERK